MTITSKNYRLFRVMPVVFVFIVCFIIAFHFRFNTNPILSTGIVVDLTITAPVLYFFLIRKSSISNATVFRVFIIGVIFSGILLHNKNIPYLIALKKWVVPVIECGTIIFISNRFLIAKKTLRKKKNVTIDFLQHCRVLLFNVIGNEKLATILASEFAVFYYLFIWKRNIAENNNGIFSYHKTGNTRLILATFIGLILIETIVFHFLLTIWSVTIAWIFTMFSLYTCLQLLAHIKAMKHRPILVFKEMIALRNGLAGDVDIDVKNITTIELTNKNVVGNNVVKLGLLKAFEKHKIAIYLKQPVDVVGIFGVKKKGEIILLHVDNPKGFLDAIKYKPE